MINQFEVSALIRVEDEGREGRERKGRELGRIKR